ncbi:hypothetical protein B0H11DRAFT_1926382 [Mycena galericulata]|nr:hypothetical protein B0H11DRAFT_1926382 [Mycena galericulata]
MASIRRDVSIFGATGVQGAARVCSAVVESLLEDGTFIPRAMIHQEESRVGSLKERGVEVVKGDSGDKASLLSALRRSEAVKAIMKQTSHAEYDGLYTDVDTLVANPDLVALEDFMEELKRHFGKTE